MNPFDPDAPPFLGKAHAAPLTKPAEGRASATFAVQHPSGFKQEGAWMVMVDGKPRKAHAPMIEVRFNLQIKAVEITFDREESVVHVDLTFRGPDRDDAWGHKRSTLKLGASGALDIPLALLIRDTLIMAVTHEVDEGLLINGVRVHDPHDPAKNLEEEVSDRPPERKRKS